MHRSGRQLTTKYLARDNVALKCLFISTEVIVATICYFTDSTFNMNTTGFVVWRSMCVKLASSASRLSL